MGNNSTAQHCFSKLEIPSHHQSAFKRDVLEFIKSESSWGGDITPLREGQLSRFTDAYIWSDRIQKFYQKPERDRALQAQPDELQTHEQILQLLKIWVEEEKKRQSQEDPAYPKQPTDSSKTADNTTTPKKRKRQPDKARAPKAPKEKLVKKVQTEQANSKATARSKAMLLSSDIQGDNPMASFSTTNNNNNLIQSPTVASSLQDIPHRLTTQTQGVLIDDDDDDLPEVAELLSQTQSREDTQKFNTQHEQPTVTLQSKGKNPVRDPPTPAPGITIDNEAPSPVTPTPITSAPSAAVREHTSHQRYDSDQDLTRISPYLNADLQQVHSRKDMRSVEAIREDYSTSPTVTGFLDQAGPSGITKPLSDHDIPTPPPTNRRLQFDRPIELDGAHTRLFSTTRDLPREDRVLELVYSIRKYIDDCEEHSVAVASSSTSSEREKHDHQVRAMIFAHLRSDVGSRIQAFFEDENSAEVTRKSKVTSYCLWS